MAGYKADLAAYKKDLKRFERTGERHSPMEPTRPVCGRCLVSDATIEGLVPILTDNWRGVVRQRDELVECIGGVDKYSKAGNASCDAAHWLSIYHADAIVVDRKTGEPKTLFVPDPAISVCGGIQPGILKRVLNTEHRQNGLAARMLMTYPPRRAIQWSDDEIPEAQEAALEELLSELFNLQPATCNLQPATCNLQPATCNLQPATCNLQPATVDRRPVRTSNRSRGLCSCRMLRETRSSITTTTPGRNKPA